mgnify:CR=1 FL=1
MKLSEILKDLTILDTNADLNADITDVCYDSRQAKPGSLFVAIAGAETDGHRYIPMAHDKGAACVVCQHAPEADIPYVVVEDSRRALAVIGCNWFDHPSRELTMIGVTGTSGKTTSTYLIKSILEQKAGAKVGLIGTIQNMIGSEVLHTERTTPESFELQKLFRRMSDAGCTHVVMEVSSHALMLDRVYGIPFAVGIYTNLSRDHLDFHKTMETYAEAKALLFVQSDAGIVNADDPWARVMLERAKCPMQTYSAKRNDADLVAKDIRLSASGVRFVAMSGDALARMRLGIPGMFSVYNALSVIACARALGISLDDCAAALDTAKPVKGRAEPLETDGDYTILIDYAVTPDAIDNILTTVREFAPARLVFLFGCGGDRDRGKRPKMGRIAGQKADFVIVTSDNPRTEDPEAIIADILPGLKETHTPYVVRPDRREAIAYAIENHCPGDVIILCGKGHEDYQIIGKTKVHMDEREIVAEILDKRKREKEK